MTKAIILGVDSQDGSYLAELLLSKGYTVVGWITRDVPVRLDHIQHILNKITLVQGSLLDQASLDGLFEGEQPDEIYNLAAPSFPAGSWADSVTFGDVAGLGVARLLEGIRRIHPTARFYQASTSELFGDPVETPQRETTPFRPRNPYGIAKLYAHWLTVRYREQFGLYAVSGILYNHESPRRGPEFVTRKISRTAAQIYVGQATRLALGNLDARRDWGFAGDYVRAMWQMLQLDTPQDFVVGTGVTHSVREFCERAFACLGLDYEDWVDVDPSFYRPPEPHQLVADPSRAHTILGWQPQVSFSELVQLMVAADLEDVRGHQVG